MVAITQNSALSPNSTVNNLPSVDQITSESVSKYLSCVGVGANLTEAEKTQFIEICVLQQLNPFKREVYPVKYNKQSEFQILTGYEVYIKRAEKSSLLDNWSVYSQREVNPFTGKEELASICEIERSDRNKTLVTKVFYSEFVKYTNKGEPNKFWKQMPIVMLEKCAIARAFRFAFPLEVGGMPYTSDEIQVSDEPRTNQIQKQKEEKLKAEEEEKKALFNDIDNYIEENKDFVGSESVQLLTMRNKKTSLKFIKETFDLLKESSSKKRTEAEEKESLINEIESLIDEKPEVLKNEKTGELMNKENVLNTISKFALKGIKDQLGKLKNKIETLNKEITENDIDVIVEAYTTDLECP